MASTKGNGIRRDRSISSADAWICGASPLAASMKADEAAFDMEPLVPPPLGFCYRRSLRCVAVVTRVKMLDPAMEGGDDRPARYAASPPFDRTEAPPIV